MKIDRGEFFNWAFDDLLSNSLRGILAEFIVAKALGVQLTRRVEWDSYDLVSARGMKIEVKSSAYLQTWQQARPSKIVFSVGRKRSLDSVSNSYSLEAKRAADVYVFCVFKEQDRNLANPLDVLQWSFLVCPSPVLDERLGDQQSATLPRLMMLGIQSLDFDGLREELQRLDATLGSHPAI